MEILLDFCYYITLFFIPIAFYALFLKNTDRFLNNKDWFYVIKIIFATAAIKKYQRKCRRTLAEISQPTLENPKEIQSLQSSDSHFIYGTDRHGNSLSLRLTIRGDERGYEQFGALRGFIRGDSFADDLLLNLPSCRTRFWGTAEKLAVERSIHLFVAGKDGTLISLWVKMLKKGCSGLKYGNAITNTGDIVPITDSDIAIENLGQNGSFPAAFTVHVRAKRKIYKIVFHVGLKKVAQARNEESRGYDLSNATADCDLNHFQAKSLFIVPDGFIVTVSAFNKQLEANFNMKKAVAILDDICCGRTKGNLESACAATVKTFEREKILPEIVKAVLKALRKFKSDDVIRWAVRSSGVGEDSEELSAAGQNRTFLGCVTADDVVRSISSCWASLFTYQSVKYRHQHGLAVQSEMAVVVQKMIPADCAGVLFTCHPSTSNPAQIVITANHGLGEVKTAQQTTQSDCTISFQSVVSGQSDPDTVILERTFDNDLTIKSKTLGTKRKMIKMTDAGVEEAEGLEGFSITDNQALDLGRVGVFLEETFGGARDIEWAFCQGQLFLLQSRPVTTLNSWTDFELLHEFDLTTLTDDLVYSIGNTGEVLPGAISTLTVTSIVPEVDEAMRRNINDKIDRYSVKCLPIFQNHMFIDVLNLIHQKVSKTVKLSSKIVDIAIFGHPVINETIHSLALEKFGVVSTANVVKDLVEMFKTAWRNEEYLKKLKNEVENFDLKIDNERDTIKDVYAKINSSLNKTADVFQLHGLTTRTSVTYQIMSMTILAERNEDFTTDHYSDVGMLLSSCNEVISAEIPAILARIARTITQNGGSDKFAKIDPKFGRSWLKTNCPEASEMFDEFLRDHGHRCLGEIDLCKRTWAMDPDEVVKMIQANCKISTARQANVARSIDDVIAGLQSPKNASTRKILKFLVKKSRRAVGVREQSKSECIKFVDKLRTAYRQLAHKMALAGLLPDPDLIFHLSHYELGRVTERENPALIAKLITVACMPPPVSSAVILTRAANGNETAAIFNSVLGSFLGIIITPLSLLFNLGSTTIVPLLATVVQLTTTVLIPLFLGQIIRNFTGFRGHTIPLNSIGQCALLFVIYTTFCDTFETPETGLSALDVLLTVFSVLIMQMLLMGLSYAMARYLKKHFTVQDIIAIIFCSTHKSLTLGAYASR
ncbi:PPDK N, DUF4137, and/or SBF domain containing protein [Asbolus verrucosus]|uniref:PPDK N, DUF4137, and/or SBF domain containing protein n=1 Tax=Asbolus verrucosus TaxID=1661398 RepID=A0A482W1A2_ASBVE|nr:PPDK N, DUF4137, and/or SBF domain containing protein [Asbolus verrucosus]